LSGDPRNAGAQTFVNICIDAELQHDLSCGQT
jgi:hypothetical protein